MEAKWLEDFLALADTRSFSRAAQRRHLTQSAFSRRIRALEAWLGVELIDRSTYPTRLTAAGETFRGEAESMLRRIEDTRALLRGESGSSRNAIRFALAHTLALSFFPRWLRDIVRSFGPIATRVLTTNVHDAVTDLVEGHSDLLMCYHHPRHSIELDPIRYPMLRLGTETVLPYSAPGAGGPLHRLPGTSAAPLPFLAYSAPAYLSRVVDSILRESPQRAWLDRRYESDMSESLKVMAQEGHGVAWLPEQAVRRDVREGRLMLAAAPGGEDHWRGEMEVRLYRDAERTRPAVAVLWAQLSAPAAPAALRPPGAAADGPAAAVPAAARDAA